MEETRYDFGDNWHDFINDLQQSQIDSAKNDLKSLIGDISGKSFLDIGSGSGLHSLAALSLGAKWVTAIDYDPMSVKSTRALLSHHAANLPWEANHDDILKSSITTKYDIVYSWGVLHHTGDMWRAIENAAAKCKKGGILALALYNKTPFCALWKHEKRLYSKYRFIRPLFNILFSTALLLRTALTGTNPFRYISEYNSNRGMSFMTDIRDWLGGYPYESVSDTELVNKLQGMGFQLMTQKNTTPSLGLFGSGCGEWVFMKQ